MVDTATFRAHCTVITKLSSNSNEKWENILEGLHRIESAFSRKIWDSVVLKPELSLFITSMFIHLNDCNENNLLYVYCPNRTNEFFYPSSSFSSMHTCVDLGFMKMDKLFSAPRRIRTRAIVHGYSTSVISTVK